MPLTPGTRLGPYEITGLLGAGGMGECTAPSDPRLGRNVAIKTCLRPSRRTAIASGDIVLFQGLKGRR